MWRIDEPSLTVASRGLCGLELTLTAAAKDLHSGRHGGGVANPLHAMAALIASLHEPNGRVAVAGFYDARARAVARASARRLPRCRTTSAAYLAQVGAACGFGEPGYTTLERQWTRPTLEVNGMWGGYQGPGQKTVIPSEAHAKITCRLVPDQDPDAGGGARGAASRGPCAAGHPAVAVDRGPRLARGAHQAATTSR